MNNQDIISPATAVLPVEKPTEGTSKSRRSYQKTGLYAAKTALKEFGDRALDGRTGPAKALAQWRNELVADLGGSKEVSAQEMVIVDLAAKSKLLLDSLDAWLLQQKSLINVRKRSVFPVVLQRQQLADALARYMGQLGLRKRAKPTKSLSEVLAAESSMQGDV